MKVQRSEKMAFAIQNKLTRESRPEIKQNFVVKATEGLKDKQDIILREKRHFDKDGPSTRNTCTALPRQITQYFSRNCSWETKFSETTSHRESGT